MKEDPKKARQDLLVIVSVIVAGAVGIWLFNQYSERPTEQPPSLAGGENPQIPIEHNLPGPYDGTPRREQPDYTPAEVLPEIPLEPTDQQIAGSRLFGLRLMASEQTGEKENRAVGKLLRELRGLDEEISQKVDRETDPHGFERAYRKEKFARVESWLKGNADSPWAAALRHELAGYRYDRGYLDEARAGWEQNWAALREAPAGTDAYQLANEALGKLLDLTRGYARVEQLRELVAAGQDRRWGSALKGKLFHADRSLWLLEHRGAQNVMCGPLALNCINHKLGKPITPPMLGKVSQEYIGIGLPLTEVARYAGENYRVEARMARRENNDAAIPVPAVVHDKDEHYFAVLESSESDDEYLIEDRTRDYAGWIDREALEARSSGYFLLASNEPIEQLPSGWSAVGEDEGRQVFGRDKDHNTEECNTECCPSGDCNGMPRYTIHRLPAILRLNDVPLGYQPPVGYGVNFYLSHLDIDSGSPGSSPPFSNVGFTWSVRWIAWVDHQPGALDANSVIKVHVPGGGLIRHRYDDNNQPLREPQSGAVLTRTGSHTYTRTAMDGSKEVYGVADNPSAPNRVFLSQMIDANGNTLSFGYDAQMRLITVTDAIGQVTTLQYNHPSDIYKITSVTDPFNRTAVLDYDPVDGDKLAKITDQIGLETTFVWNSNDDVESMTTPYGTTQFETFGHTNTGSGAGTAVSWVKVTDPQGDVEKVEYVDRGFENVDAINPPPSSVTVAGQTIPIFTDEASLGSRATFVWDKEAWHQAPNDHSAATMLQWYTNTDWKVIPVLQAKKTPNEDVIWYDYPGTQSVDDPSVTVTSNLDMSQGIQPTKILRVQGDGTPVLTQIEYNAQGQTKKVIDPLGRSTEFTYSADGLNLLSVRQTSGGINETLISVSYNAAHQPTSVTNAAGQTTLITYNARGQVVAVTNALGESTTSAYDANGFLQSVDGPLSGNADLTSYGYDALGRPNSMTSGGQTVTMTFDAFDRVTRVDYPDSTFMANTYEKLNLKTSRDRLGRTTTYGHDALGQVTSVSDPLGRSTVLEWCRCGDIRKLTDAMGRVTQWQRDIQGRPVQKSYPDGSTESWNYDLSMGYLTSTTRRNGQSVAYTYTLDGRVASIAYPPAAGFPASAGISYTYDAIYGRLATMTDGIGTSTYSYHSAGSLGAGALATLDGPWANDTVAYTYDALGRLAGHTIDGVSFGTNRNYDPLGRLTSITNALGAFQHTYDTSSHLGVTNVTYPNGMQIDYSYQGANGGHRLASIHNRNQGGGTLSRFNYAYDNAGQITSWTRELTSGTSTYNFGYDAAGQLTSSILTPAGQPAGATRHYSYTSAGNRTAEGPANDETTALFNNLNQMTQFTPEQSSLWTLVAGQLNEPAEVRVDGQPVPITSDNRFERNMNLLPGTYQVPVEATDRDGNTGTKNYEITVNDPVPQVMQYDSAGNLVRQVRADGTARIFEWDGLGRLLAIQSDEAPAANDWRTEFTYDGMGRRVKREEFTHDGSGWVQDASVTFLWCGTELCQEREASGGAVRVHFLPQGFVRGSFKAYTTRDHLGSVREVVSEGGVLYAAFDYDPWGRVERLYGNPAFEVPFRYTGHHYHERSELHLAPYRAYDPALGRWINADPIGENGGINLYGYVGNDPVNLLDPLGTYSINADGSINHEWGEYFGDIGKAVGGGLAAFVDGAISLVPGVDNPLADLGAYNDCDPAFSFSQDAGQGVGLMWAAYGLASGAAALTPASPTLYGGAGFATVGITGSPQAGQFVHAVWQQGGAWMHSVGTPSLMAGTQLVTNKGVQQFVNRMYFQLSIPVADTARVGLPNGSRGVSNCFSAAARAVAAGWGY